jgi:hypothetical protein
MHLEAHRRDQVLKVELEGARVGDQDGAAPQAPSKQGGLRPSNQSGVNAGRPGGVPGIPEIHDPRQAVPPGEVMSHEVSDPRRRCRNHRVEADSSQQVVGRLDGRPKPPDLEIGKSQPGERPVPQEQGRSRIWSSEVRLGGVTRSRRRRVGPGPQALPGAKRRVPQRPADFGPDDVALRKVEGRIFGARALAELRSHRQHPGFHSQVAQLRHELIGANGADLAVGRKVVGDEEDPQARVGRLMCLTTPYGRAPMDR